MKRRSAVEWFTLFIFIIPFLIPTLIQFLKLPSFLKYTIDVLWVVSFFILLFKRKLAIKKELIPFVTFIAIYFIYTLVCYFFNYQSFLYYLWGFRNNFRFYIAFILFAVVLEKDDTDNCLNFLDILFWINVVVSFFQFFVLKYKQDYLGGIFGVERGSNAATLIFFSIIVAKSFLNFAQKKEKTSMFLIKCSLSLLISALAELKFFFVLCVVIIFVGVILTRPSIKFILTISLVIILVFIVGSILPSLFGESSNISFGRIVELVTAKNYATSEDLGRFTAIPTISGNIHKNNYDRLFGLGLGNCDTATYAIFNTPFFQQYSELHYTWFSSAFIFLETGFVGLIINLSFYIICFVYSLKNIKRKKGVLIYSRMALIASTVCIVLTFYNASLRTEFAYLIYFILALPFINASNEEPQLLN